MRQKKSINRKEKNNSCHFTMTVTVQTSVHGATQDNHIPRLRGNLEGTRAGDPLPEGVAHRGVGDTKPLVPPLATHSNIEMECTVWELPVLTPITDTLSEAHAKWSRLRPTATLPKGP